MIKVVVRNFWRIYISIFQFLYLWKPWCWSLYFKNKDLSEWKAKEFRKIWFFIPGLHIWKENVDIDFSKSTCSTSRKHLPWKTMYWNYWNQEKVEIWCYPFLIKYLLSQQFRIFCWYIFIIDWNLACPNNRCTPNCFASIENWLYLPLYFSNITVKFWITL